MHYLIYLLKYLIYLLKYVFIHHTNILKILVKYLLGAHGPMGPKSAQRTDGRAAFWGQGPGPWAPNKYVILCLIFLNVKSIYIYIFP